MLKVLQKSYFGKIKMIYIDPPYNTGNDSFIYPDKFSESKEDYQKRVGDKDEEGYMTREGLFHKNSKENGQYHSNWLNMMYPRLFLARNLLRDDGVIFVSIDDNEVHNLRMLMNEIFGEENFVAQVVWQKRYSRENRGIMGDAHEYLIVYTKTIEIFKQIANKISITEKQLEIYKNSNNDPKGPWRTIPMTAQGYRPNQMYEITSPSGNIFTPSEGRCWSMIESEFLKLKDEGRIYFGKNGDSQPNVIRYLSEVEGVVPWTWWPHEEVGHTDEAKKEIREFLGQSALFDNPKPVRLIKRVLEIGTKSNDIILDFFAGSATTAHAILETNKEDISTGSVQVCDRKFICVQMPEACDEKSEAFKAGYKTIADIAKERIRSVIQKIQKENEGKLDLGENKIDLGFKVFKLHDSNFKVWRESAITSESDLKEQMMDFTNPVSPDAETENMVYELLLKSGFDPNTKIEKKKNYYAIGDNELVFLLEKADQKIIDEVIGLKPQKVIALDKLFEKNDKLKTNTVLQMKDAGIEFKSI